MPTPSDALPVVLVWGNCQAAPVADLLRHALADTPVHVPTLQPVYLVTDEAMTDIHALLARCVAFVAQPIDGVAYGARRVERMIPRLPSDCVVVRVPVAYDISPFPFQANAAGSDRRRVLAPVTDYHDLRAAVAAERGLTPEQTLAWWPSAPALAVRGLAARSRATLRRRESGLDVTVSDLLDRPDALWTMTHPTNRTLRLLAMRVLHRLRSVGAVPDGPDAPVVGREYLGQRRTPIDDGVARSLGWQAAPDRTQWLVNGKPVDLQEIIKAQLPFYRSRPDVRRDLLTRNTQRIATLGLA